jgi:hypothetical protein
MTGDVDYRNIINLIGKQNDENFHFFIRGHLHIEALLSEIIDRVYEEPQALADLGSMFYRKVKLVRARGKISKPMEELLLEINRLRNKLAHRLEYNLNFDDSFELVQKAHAAGIDFSDDTIYQDRVLSEKWYGVYGIINEVVYNTFSYLIQENNDIFTRKDIGRFLG